ncbi:proton channel OTOP3-like [Discoglossus pictus]
MEIEREMMKDSEQGSHPAAVEMGRQVQTAEAPVTSPAITDLDQMSLGDLTSLMGQVVDQSDSSQDDSPVPRIDQDPVAEDLAHAAVLVPVRTFRQGGRSVRRNRRDRMRLKDQSQCRNRPLRKQAFSIMAYVIGEKFPEQCSSLFAYLEKMRSAYRTYGGMAWWKYDEHFRNCMGAAEPGLSVDPGGPYLHYEHSWLHRHCPSPVVQHQRARQSGRLFSGLLAMNVVFLGAALVSSVILSGGFITSRDSNIFLSILMLLSSVWALYHLLATRRRTLALLLQDHHAGTRWLQASLALFGICSLLLSVFKIGYYIMLLPCKMPTDIIFSSVEILFICVQTCLLWFSCKDCIQVKHNLTRCGIMLTLATNLLLWFLAVIDDSVHRENELVNATSDVNISCSCPNFSACWTFQRGYVTMYPFNLEYSLVCASMLFVMWKNVGRKEHAYSLSPAPGFRLKGVISGPLLGGVILLVGICIFIQYQVQASVGSAPLESFLLYYGYCITILPIMIISCILGVLAHSLGEKDRHGVQHREQVDQRDGRARSKEQRQVEKGEQGQHHGENMQNYGEDRPYKQEGQEKEKVLEDQQEDMNGERGEQWNDKGEEDRQRLDEREKPWKDQLDDRPRHGEGGKPMSNHGEGRQGEVENFREVEENMELSKVEKEEHKQREKVRHRHTQEERRVRGKIHSLDSEITKNIWLGVANKNYTRSLDIILLLAAALGQFSISYYSIVALVATASWNVLNSLNLSYSVLMVLQHMLQNIFIIEGMREEHREQSQPRANKEESEEKEDTPRRMSLVEIRRASLAYLQDAGRLSVCRRAVKEISLFLVLCNIMFWIMSAFGAHPQYENGLEQQFYGSSSWMSILNFGLPLSVFYRMHSVGGLLEVYINA